MKFSRQLESMETTSQGYFLDRLPSSVSLLFSLSLWKIIFLNLLSARTITYKRNSPEEQHEEFSR